MQYVMRSQDHTIICTVVKGHIVVKATAVATKQTVATVAVKAKRPPPDGSHERERERWNETAKLVYRLTIVMLAIVTGIAVHDMALPTTYGLALDRMPDLAQHIGERIGRIQ
jgi:hypothetical protein